MLRNAVAIIAIGVLCGSLLVGVADLTSADIRTNRDAAARVLLEDLLGEAIPIGTDLSAPLLGNCKDWLILRLAQPGYAGEIELLGLWRADSQSISLRTVRHLETPGIGDFIDQRISDWMSRQDNRSLNGWTTIDSVSGATITTKAIVRGANLVAQTASVECPNTSDPSPSARDVSESLNG